MNAEPTPVVPLTRCGPGLWGKLELLHPSGSIKHRSIPRLLADERDRGRLPKGRAVVIHSAGSAAITTAWAGARLGCPVHAIIPRSAAAGVEHRLQWWGAHCHRLPSKQAPEFIAGLVEGGAYRLDQQCEAGLVEHYRVIGAELLGALPQLAAVVVGVGTGASVSGIARELKARGSGCEVIGVEPQECRVAAGRPWAPHGIPGLAPPFDQPLLDRALIDQFVGIESTTAWARARQLARDEGWAACPASGANVEAALRVRERLGAGPVVALLSGSIAPLLGSEPDFDLTSGQSCPSPAECS